MLSDKGKALDPSDVSLDFIAVRGAIHVMAEICQRFLIGFEMPVQWL